MKPEPIEPEYPEHEKLLAIHEQSLTIANFLENCEYRLGELVTFEGHSNPSFVPVSKSIENILSEYFGIDQNKLEQEKRQMLAQAR